MPNTRTKPTKARAGGSTARPKRRLRESAQTPEDVILDRLAMSKSEFPNVYWVGRKAMRLTFLSQQQRSLNLIWALNKKGMFRDRPKVTVVGAGLAGLTAAFAASQLGASVTLIDSKHTALHLQLGCWLRFVHPHILDWPKEGSENPLTDLPCLNWGADMAAHVSESVIDQWSLVEKTVQAYYGYEVRRIGMLSGGRPLVYAERGVVAEQKVPEEAKGKAGEPRAEAEEGKDRAEERRGNYEQDCDCLILAVGFGLEKSLPSVPFLSYWENDNFGRPLITGPIPRKYLVTGCGDGGLIDAIRLSLNAFNHAEFVYKLSTTPGLDDIKRELLRIDGDVALKVKSHRNTRKRINEMIREAGERAGASFDKARARKRAEIEVQGELLEQAYRRLPEIPAKLKELITKRLRTDTFVYLNSPSISPLSLGASILNRFVVFLLRKYGSLRYRAGEVEIIPTLPGQPLRVIFRHDLFPPEELQVHEIVVRHGPVPAIDRLFPKHIVDAARVVSDDFDDPTRKEHYKAAGEKFLDSPLLTQRKLNVYRDHALSSALLVAKNEFSNASYDRFGVEVKKDKVRYVRRMRGGAKLASSTPTYCLGLELHSEPPADSAADGPPVATPESHLALISGVGVRNIGSPSGPTRGPAAETIGTLGCFVSLNKSGDVALLTTASSHLRPHLAAGDRIVLAGESHKEKPKVIATVTDFRMPETSSPRSSVSAGTVEYNQFEAAVATLAPGVEPKLGFGEAYPDAPALKYEAQPFPPGEEARALEGAKVFKVGAMTSLTRGRIEAVMVKDELQYQGVRCWFDNLIAVSSCGPDPFATPGDDGALLIKEDGTILGMVIGGSDIITYACPIEPVLAAFDCVPILTEAGLAGWSEPARAPSRAK